MGVVMVLCEHIETGEVMYQCCERGGDPPSGWRRKHPHEDKDWLQKRIAELEALIRETKEYKPTDCDFQCVYDTVHLNNGDGEGCECLYGRLRRAVPALASALPEKEGGA